MFNTQSDNCLPKKCGFICDNIPLLKMDGVTDIQAKAAYNNLNCAYVYLSKNVSDSYSKLHKYVQEIHIVSTLDNNNKYSWNNEENKAVLKIIHDITYADACYCLFDIGHST